MRVFKLFSAPTPAVGGMESSKVPVRLLLFLNCDQAIAPGAWPVR